MAQTPFPGQRVDGTENARTEVESSSVVLIVVNCGVSQTRYSALYLDRLVVWLAQSRQCSVVLAAVFVSGLAGLLAACQQCDL